MYHCRFDITGPSKAQCEVDFPTALLADPFASTLSSRHGGNTQARQYRSNICSYIATTVSTKPPRTPGPKTPGPKTARSRSRTQPLPRNLPLLPLQHFRMPMHTRTQPHPHTPPHRLANPPLIHPPQSRLPSPLQPPHPGHKLAHHAEIRILAQRVQVQHIERVAALGFGGGQGRRVTGAGALGAEFLLLDGREVVRGVDVTGAEAPVQVRGEVSGAVGGGGFVEGGAAHGGGGTAGGRGVDEALHGLYGGGPGVGGCWEGWVRVGSWDSVRDVDGRISWMGFLTLWFGGEVLLGGGEGTGVVEAFV